jgi:hypothetical protein
MPYRRLECVSTYTPVIKEVNLELQEEETM